MAIAIKDDHHWTREEYERRVEEGFFQPGDRVELVDGVPFIQSLGYEYPYWLSRIVGGTLLFLSHLVFAANMVAMRPRGGELAPAVEEAA